MKIVSLPFRPFGFDALTFYPWVFVWKLARWDEGLRKHESIHYGEQSFGRWSWWFNYLFFPPFRLAAEVRAYRAQISIGGISPSLAASFLTRYGTGVTYAEALTLLQGAA